MSRTQRRPPAQQQRRLEPQRTTCIACEHPMWVAYHTKRTILTLQGLCQIRLVVRRCRNQACSRYQHPYRPEEEGRWALPHGECGLDVIALVGTLRYREHRSVPEIHQELAKRGVQVCERTVEHALHRYEELVTVHMQHKERLQGQMKEQGRALLAIDGLQPDVGHEVLWVRGIRAIERSLEGEGEEEAPIVREYCFAVRSALTDDGHPPLSAPGLKLHDRLTQISASIERVAEKRGFPFHLSACNDS